MTSYKFVGFTGPGSDVVAWLIAYGYKPDEMSIYDISSQGYTSFVLDDEGKCVIDKRVRRRWHSPLDWLEFKSVFGKWLVWVD